MNLRISITLTIAIKKKDFLNGELQNCVKINCKINRNQNDEITYKKIIW